MKSSFENKSVQTVEINETQATAMTKRLLKETTPAIATLDDLAELADYSFVDTLNCDPDA